MPKTMNGAHECVSAKRAVGIPATAPPIMGRKSKSATHRAHSKANGTPRITRVTKTTTPAMIDVMKLPSMYPVTDRLTSPATRVTRAARSGAMSREDTQAQLGSLEQQQEHEDEDHEEVEADRERAGPELERRLGQVLGVTLQLGEVLLDPVLDVVPAHEVADVALAVFGTVHVVRELRDEVGQPVGERVAERVGETGEHEHGQHRDDGHGVAPSAHPHPLQQDHQRVQQQRDEPRHRHEQDDLAQLVDELAGQDRGHHHADRDQDGQEGDMTFVGPLPKPAAPGHGGRRDLRHPLQHGSPTLADRGTGRRRSTGLARPGPLTWKHGSDGRREPRSPRGGGGCADRSSGGSTRSGCSSSSSTWSSPSSPAPASP